MNVTLKTLFCIACIVCLFACGRYNSNSCHLPSYFLPTELKHDTCICLETDIEFLVNLYIKTADKKYLNKALCYIDSAFHSCSDKNNALSWRFKIFLLQRDYINGINFFKRIDSLSFHPLFLRTYYINTLRSMIDTAKRNTLNRNIIIEMEVYMNSWHIDGMNTDSNLHYNINNSFIGYYRRDSKTINDYYIVRARYENIDSLIMELNSMRIDTNEAETYYWRTYDFPNLLYVLDSLKKK